MGWIIFCLDNSCYKVTILNLYDLRFCDLQRNDWIVRSCVLWMKLRPKSVFPDRFVWASSHKGLSKPWERFSIFGAPPDFCLDLRPFWLDAHTKRTGKTGFLAGAYLGRRSGLTGVYDYMVWGLSSFGFRAGVQSDRGCIEGSWFRETGCEVKQFRIYDWGLRAQGL